MIRHRCTACGRRINRTDHFFEPSDGRVCAACRPCPGPAGSHAAAGGRTAPIPAWARLPRLARSPA